MDVSRLKEIVDFLLQMEQELQIQQKLNEANSNLQNIISQPQQPQFQTQFSAAVQKLHNALRSVAENLQPTQITLVNEIKGVPFFVDDFASHIDTWIRENAVTPAVAQQQIQSLLEQRQIYIDQLRQLQTSLNAVGIESTHLNPVKPKLASFCREHSFATSFRD